MSELKEARGTALGGAVTPCIEPRHQELPSSGNARQTAEGVALI